MRELNARRADITKEMRGIVAAPAGDGGDLSEEQEKRFDGLKAELEKVEKAIERQQAIDDAERRMAGNKPEGEFAREQRACSVQRAIQHLMGMNVDAGRELEVSAELARQEGRSTEGLILPYGALFIDKRSAGTMTTAAPVGGPGSNLIGTDHLAGQYVDLLREADPLAGLGIRHLHGLRGNVSIPKMTSGNAVSWFGENASIPQSDAAFGAVTMSPKHCGAWVEWSRNMPQQSSPDIESLMREDLARTMATEIARVILEGSGTSNEPTGILASSIETVETPESNMSYVPALADKLLTNNVSNVRFVVWNGFKVTVDNLLTTDKLPVGESAFFRGYPHVWTGLLTSTNMLAGDFSQVLVGHWGGVELLLNPYMESAYKKGNVALRIVCTIDVALRHPEAFAVLAASNNNDTDTTTSTDTSTDTE